jgi:transposase-like protein
MAYDKKFRRCVIEYKDAGHTFAEVYEAFGVNPQRYYSWKKPAHLNTNRQKNAMVT